jgi:cytosine/adenosine deaminase-related metal-dependent hydrolase
VEIRDQPYTLTSCDFVFTGQQILKNTNIIIDNGRIMEIGPEKEGDIFSCSGMIVIPGLINAHTHSGMTYLRGYKDDLDLIPWLKEIWSIESKALPHWIRLSSEASIIEMLSNGITGFIDMYFNPKDVAELSEIYGIKVSAGPTFLDSLKDPYEIDKEMREVSTMASSTFSPIINVHSLYAVSEETLKLARQLFEELGLGIHIHVSETREELFQVKQRYGIFPVEVLKSKGLLGPRTIMAHLGWISSWEIELVKSMEAHAVHCPTSNMKLATGGFFPLKEMLARGINVALGTDGPATNNTLDIFREMKEAVLLERQGYWEASVGAKDAIRMATLGGRKAVRLEGGVIERGAPADLSLVDMSNLGPITESNLNSILTYVATGRDIDYTIIDGKLVYRRGLYDSRLKQIYAELTTIQESLS